MPRNYSNVAEQTSLASGINNSATSITVGSNTGYPSVPYSIIIDPGLATEEVCEVTAVAGVTWTVTRGVDGTPSTSHDTGAGVVHGYSARDLRDIQDHIGDATGVHGIGASSSVVGTIDSQTLTNKILTAPTINGGTWNSPTFGSGITLASPTLITPTIASFVNAQHTHSDASSGGSLGGSGTYFFPAAVSASGGWSTPTGNTNVPSMSITYTAPAAWPTGATGIEYNFTTEVLANAGTSAYADFTSDGVAFPGNVFHINLPVGGFTQQIFHMSWVRSLTTAGVAHTATVRGGSTLNNGLQFVDRQFWLTLV